MQYILADKWAIRVTLIKADAWKKHILSQHKGGTKRVGKKKSRNHFFSAKAMKAKRHMQTHLRVGN